MDTKYTRYLFIFVLAIIVILSFLIIKPLINVFLWSLILAYLFYPLYSWIHKKTGRPSISSFITIVIMVLLVIIPLFLIIKGVSEEAFGFYSNAKEQLSKGGALSMTSLHDRCIAEDTTLCEGILWLERAFTTFFPPELTKQVLQKVTSATMSSIIAGIVALPKLILHIALAFFITFFLLRDWVKFKDQVSHYIPFKQDDMERILGRINTVTHSILFASILVAIIQGVLGMIGFWVVGLPSPIVLGAIMGFFALIPMVGTGIIWVPASLFLIGKGLIFDSNMIVYQGIGLFLYGLLFISVIDNVLRPKLAGDAAQIHPIIVIAGVIGGTSFFGFVGIFVGPLVLALLITLVRMAIEKYHVQ